MQPTRYQNVIRVVSLPFARMALTKAFQLLLLTSMFTISGCKNGDSLDDADPQPQVKNNSSPSYLIRNVKIFDGEKFLDGRSSVFIRDGIIANIGPEAGSAIADIEVNGDGSVLLPGFIDAHTHTFYANQLSLSVDFGVTTHLDMHTHPQTMLSAYTINDGRFSTRVHADLFSSGVLATSAHGHGAQFFEIDTVDSPIEAEAFVFEQVNSGASYIKIVYKHDVVDPSDSLTYEAASAVIAAAKSQGLMVIAHVSDNRSAADVLTMGVDALAHVLVGESSISEEVLTLLRNNDAFLISTMTVFAQYSYYMNYDSFLYHDYLTSVFDGDQREELGNARARWVMQDPAITRERNERMVNLFGQINQLKEAEVPILMGTDAPNSATLFGMNAHHELALLVEAGLSIEQALTSATGLVANRFGFLDRGYIREGLLADVVLVDGDLEENIQYTKNIRQVWKSGRAVYD